MVERSCHIVNRGVQFLSLLYVALLCGCMAQQGDLKKAERDFMQASAKQMQEITTLRESLIPQLRGELDKALRITQMLHTRQEQQGQIELRLNRLEKQNEGDKSSLAQRLDSLDLVIGKLLLRIEEIERRLSGKDNR